MDQDLAMAVVVLLTARKRYAEAMVVFLCFAALLCEGEAFNLPWEGLVVGHQTAVVLLRHTKTGELSFLLQRIHHQTRVCPTSYNAVLTTQCASG